MPADFLEAQGVQPWSDLPVWIPDSPILNVLAERSPIRGQP